MRAAERAAAQVAVLLPSVAGRLAEVVGRLARAAPADGPTVFCQGDLVPSQILCDPTGWSVLDLDDAHHADPYAEVAALWVALPRELSVKDPARGERLREAYLRSYRDHRTDPARPGAGTTTSDAIGTAGGTAGGTAAAGWDEGRWRWHLAVARLRLVARRVVKGRAVPGETEAALDGLDPVAAVL